MILPTLDKLIKKLQNVPYLASKNLYRVAMHFLESDEKHLRDFCNTIIEAKRKLSRCHDCFSWTESGKLCNICSNAKRDKSVVCVVETWLNLLAIEKAGGYNGLYHVLGGVLCPLDGIGPEDLTISALINRVHNNDLKEVIFATNPTPEGEATASFISSKLDDCDIKISKLASGVPIGSSLDYMDRVTIHKALQGRRPF